MEFHTFLTLLYSITFRPLVFAFLELSEGFLISHRFAALLLMSLVLTG